MRVIKLLLIILVFASSLLIGCSSGGGSNDRLFADLKLSIDQMSPIPLVNGNGQNFYIYATNYGASSLPQYYTHLYRFYNNLSKNTLFSQFYAT